MFANSYQPFHIGYHIIKLTPCVSLSVFSSLHLSLLHPSKQVAIQKEAAAALHGNVRVSVETGTLYSEGPGLITLHV